jgi:hypothetical protein
MCPQRLISGSNRGVLYCHLFLKSETLRTRCLKFNQCSSNFWFLCFLCGHKPAPTFKGLRAVNYHLLYVHPDIAQIFKPNGVAIAQSVFQRAGRQGLKFWQGEYFSVLHSVHTNSDATHHGSHQHTHTWPGGGGACGWSETGTKAIMRHVNIITAGPYLGLSGDERAGRV